MDGKRGGSTKSGKSGKSGKSDKSDKVVKSSKAGKSAKRTKPDKPVKATKLGEPGASHSPPGVAAYPALAVTVDLVVLTIRSGALHVLLVERGEQPYRGQLALPGGFLRIDESLRDAAHRELAAHTGLGLARAGHLEQLGSYGRPDRDPRMRTVSVAYLALVPQLPESVAGPVADTDPAIARWVPVGDLTTTSGPAPLAFDHDAILADGVQRARAKLEYTALATVFCPPEFTISQLREVYETVWGHAVDPRNFHRKATRTVGLLEPTGRRTSGETGRPAQLYRRGTTDVIDPPLNRS
ncbi:MAG: hypothetical protein CSA84_02445 [Actinomycetales bacterium]|nr:MAG: hypothetical protein CSA84_02445 [Actinomycetales bacterium]